MKRMIISIAVAMVISSCNSEYKEESKNPESGRIAVKVAEIKPQKVTARFCYSGTVEPFQTIPLNFKTTGTVATVLAEEGEMVAKGQLLATLDETDAQSMYGIAKSQYQQAKDAYDRLKQVHDQGSLPEIKWVEMETKLDQAASSLNLAKNNLDKCRLVSPVNGMVGRRNTEPGMTSVSVTSAPLELVDIRQIYVKISIPENEVARISKGMTALFTVNALGNRPFSGTVYSVSPVADKIARTYEAKILAQNPGMELKPGMVCDVSMEKVSEKEVILVPYQAVSKGPDNHTYIYIADLNEKRALKQTIVTGQCFEDGIEVLSGLVSGQWAIVEGKEKLNDKSLISF